MNACAHVCRGRRIAPAHEAPRNESNNKPHEPTSGRSTHYGSGHLIRVSRDIGHIFSSLYPSLAVLFLSRFAPCPGFVGLRKDLFVVPWCGCLDMLAPLECVAGELQRPRRRSAQWACADGWHVRAGRRNSRTNVFPVLASWLLGSREIRLPAKAKACDVCAKAALRISTLHRRCLHDVI